MSNIMFSADLHKFVVSAYKEIIGRQTGTQTWPPENVATEANTRSIEFFIDALDSNAISLEEALLAMAGCLPTKKEFLEDELGKDYLPQALEKHFVFVCKSEEYEKSVAKERFEELKKDALRRFTSHNERVKCRNQLGERSVMIAVCTFCADGDARTANCVASCGHMFICHKCLEKKKDAFSYCMLCGAEITGITVMKPLEQVR